jgi:hypothetical protein
MKTVSGVRGGWAVVALVACLPACSSAPATDPATTPAPAASFTPTGPVAEENLVALFVEVYGAQCTDCCAAAGRTPQEDCATTVRALADASSKQAHDAGAVYSAVAAGECIDGWKKLKGRCYEFGEVRDTLAPCGRIYTGHQAAGSACTGHFQCAAGEGQVGQCAESPSGPTNCVVLTQAALGQACDEPSITSLPTAPALVRICDDLARNHCDPATHTCVPLQGVACEPLAASCGGLICSLENHTCVVAPGLGEACTSPCVRGTTCEPVQKICVADPTTITNDLFLGGPSVCGGMKSISSRGAPNAWP